MMRARLTKMTRAARTPRMWRVRIGTVLVGAMMLSGCISVNAPDKPIVIELNINIKQEVVYRLADDARNTIQATPGIF